MASQPIPNVTAADVERVVRRDFPADRVAEVRALLDEYGKEKWEREPHRVRLAALKLAEGNVERLRGAIELAKRDFRDVVAPAEYPEYLRRVPRSGTLGAEERRVIDADWKQYQDWLRR